MYRRSGLTSGNHFGFGPDPIRLFNRHCTGNESSLAECRHYDHPDCHIYQCRHDDVVSIACNNG